jgi:uncharacterized protein (TIGR02996 family)
MDDEGFLQAIAAAPNDDAPRLVYADWLDERGDDRGNYLRVIMLVVERVRSGITWEDLSQTFEIACDRAPTDWQTQVGPWFAVTIDTIKPEKKIAATKTIRACTPRGLSEAKAVVDEVLAKGSSVVAKHLTLSKAQQLRKDLQTEPWTGSSGEPPCQTSLLLDKTDCSVDC